MVFQHFNLFPHKSVLDNITLAPILTQGAKRAEAEKQARELLDMVGLADKAGSMPSQLSGGMRKRAGLARAPVGQAQQVRVGRELVGEPGPLDGEVGQRLCRHRPLVGGRGRDQEGAPRTGVGARASRSGVSSAETVIQIRLPATCPARKATPAAPPPPAPPGTRRRAPPARRRSRPGCR